VGPAIALQGEAARGHGDVYSGKGGCERTLD
jgi:hypothetical protein